MIPAAPGALQEIPAAPWAFDCFAAATRTWRPSSSASFCSFAASDRTLQAFAARRCPVLEALEVPLAKAVSKEKRSSNFDEIIVHHRQYIKNTIGQ